MAVPRTSNLASSMGHEAVTIYVGSEKKRYLIHKNLLTKKSQYFDRALNGKFREAEEQSMHLTEESPAAFDFLVSFLYEDRIPTARCSDGSFAATANKNASAVIKSPQSLFYPPGDVKDTSWFEKKGSFHHIYLRHYEVDHATGFGPQLTNCFDNICAQPEYRRSSPEELRCVDYTDCRTGTPQSKPDPVVFLGRSNTLPLFPPTENGLRVAKIESKPVDPVKSDFPQATGHIPGIPYGRSIAEVAADDESHQLAILQLCLMAEKFCWPVLFNRAMTAYVQGEANFFNRVLMHEHVEIIYQRAHEESPCRSYAADAFVAQLGLKNVKSAGYAGYMDLINDYPAFLEDIFKSMSKNLFINVRAPMSLGKCEYHDHSDGKHCPKDHVHPGGHTQNSFGVPFGGPQSASYTRFPRSPEPVSTFVPTFARETAMMDWRVAQPAMPGDDSD